MVIALVAAGYAVTWAVGNIDLPEDDNRPSRMELARLPNDSDGPEYIAVVRDEVVLGGLGAERSDIVLAVSDEEGVQRIALVSIADGRFERRWFGPPVETARIDAVVVGDGVYVRHNDGVLALSYETGDVQWSQDAPLEHDTSCHLRAGCIHPVGDSHLAVATPDGGLVVLDARSGDETWSSPTGSLANASAGWIVTAQLTGRTPVLTAVAPEDGDPIDSIEMDCEIAGDELSELHGLAYGGDVVVGVNWGSCATRWDPAQGEVAWTARASARGGFVGGVQADHLLYAASVSGGLEVLDLSSGEVSQLASDDLRLLAEDLGISTDGPGHQAGPVAVADEVIVVTLGDFTIEAYAGVDRSSGEVAWAFEVPDVDGAQAGGTIRFDDHDVVAWPLDDASVVIEFDHNTGLATLERVDSSGQVRPSDPVSYEDHPDHRFGMVRLVGVAGEHMVVFAETTGFTAIPLAPGAELMRLDR